MTQLTETQSLMLTAGAQRPDNLALPLPKGLVGAAAKMAVGKMIERGWLQEVEANMRRDQTAGNLRRGKHHQMPMTIRCLSQYFRMADMGRASQMNRFFVNRAG